MIIAAMAVSPILAQQADSTRTDNEQQVDEAIEEKQVEQAIEEATGEVWVDEALEEKQEPVVEVIPVEVAEDDQDKPQQREVQTLMTGSGGYGAISVGYTRVNNLNALTMGAQGEWIVGHGFGLGIARGLAAAGGIIVVADLNFAGARQAAEEILLASNFLIAVTKDSTVNCLKKTPVLPSTIVSFKPRLKPSRPP